MLELSSIISLTFLDFSSKYIYTWYVYCQLENELRAHLAMKASLSDDISTWCWSEEWSEGDRRGERCEERRKERFKEQCEEWTEEWRDDCSSQGGSGRGFAREVPQTEGLSWYPDQPDWMWKEMSWVQRHLVDVYAIYGALVMGVGLLMKLTWNLVW